MLIKNIYSILAIISIFFLVNSCVYEHNLNSNFNYKTDLFLEASRPDGKLKIKVKAISTNSNSKKLFYTNWSYATFTINKKGKFIESPCCIEITRFLKKELVKNNYIATSYRNADQHIYIYYSVADKPLYYSFTGFIFPKMVIITSLNYESAPLWKVSLGIYNDEPDIRILLPSIIKCASPYFDRNFEDVVTCEN